MSEIAGQRLGKVTIAPEVLLTIVRLTVLSVPEVAHLCTRWRGSVGRFLTPSRLAEGIHIEIEDETATVDVHLVARSNDDMLALGHTIQVEVARAINDMVGMAVCEVNVHIEDILFAETEQ